MSSFLLMLLAFLATPYVAGYTMHFTQTGRLGGVIITTAWMWTALFWGSVVHAKQVMRLFERMQNGKKD